VKEIILYRAYLDWKLGIMCGMKYLDFGYYCDNLKANGYRII
jgi:hypothetical protein